MLALRLADLRDAQAHHDELFREFALIAGNDPSKAHDVPARLLAVIEELGGRFVAFTTGPQDELAAAMERGEVEVDVSFHVPPAIEEGAARFAELLNEADAYCRNGNLLTLAPPPSSVAFRNWYLGEFLAQARGADPTPWPEYRARSLSAP